MLRRTIHLLATGLLCLSIALPAVAQLPSRGMSMDKVLNQYGEPQRETRPVGDPPITRWVYDGFTVYFEGRYTLHAVKHRNAPADTPEPAPAQPDESRTQPEAATPEPAAPMQPQFRFDPATGRVIEVGPDGKPLDAPTASPRSAPAAAPEEDTAPAFNPATGQFRDSSRPDRKAETGKVERPAQPKPVERDTPAPVQNTGPRFNPMTGQFEPAEEAPAQSRPAEPQAPAEPETGKRPEPKPEPTPKMKPETPAPAREEAPAEPETSPLRFNPLTGQFEPVGEDRPADEPTETESGQAAPEPDEAPTAPESDAKPEPKAEEPEQAPEPAATKPADGGEPSFRFDPTTGRIIMDNSPSPTAN